ncbi:DNA polymerase IV [Acinetobacter nectaris]|uniref:DNA polymerase IV n=1 Tax=Acinetobacter nectaris TaxID=1219382 RepID=UPI001F01BAC8|nr:DNA polymerase IV [Acinetobacter nectaris]MCF9034832.1 DNA polymerase IV [Acinetobacter nectaris]
MRKIIHIDMDAFFASVELRDRPELIHQPVAIAFDNPRSVLTTASYPARKFGLHSAMPLHQAKKRCPNLTIIEPNFVKYREVSKNIHHIFQRYTNIIEPISLDEAYLDVTINLKDLASATEVAQCIQRDIYLETKLTASAGVAPNKFLAKIASDWYKPNGLCVIKPHKIQDFIHLLSLKKIPGVGKVTQAKLEKLNLYTLGDIQKIDEAILLHHFGKYGKQLYLYAQGVDERPVQNERIRQQISKEKTFDMNYTIETCQIYIYELCEQIWQSLTQKEMIAYGISLKFKRSDFHVLQHSKSFSHSFESLDQLRQASLLLIHEMNIPLNAKFRLVGVSTYHLEMHTSISQLSLW